MNMSASPQVTLVWERMGVIDIHNLFSVCIHMNGTELLYWTALHVYEDDGQLQDEKSLCYAMSNFLHYLDKYYLQTMCNMAITTKDADYVIAREH